MICSSFSMGVNLKFVPLLEIMNLNYKVTDNYYLNQLFTFSPFGIF